MIKFHKGTNPEAKRRLNMEQILNKLSEIELTANRIMEDADKTKAALSAEMEQECKAFDAELEKETNIKIQELRNSLEKKKDTEITTLRQQMETTLSDLDIFYSRYHQQLSEDLFQRMLKH